VRVFNRHRGRPLDAEPPQGVQKGRILTAAIVAGTQLGLVRYSQFRQQPGERGSHVRRLVQNRPVIGVQGLQRFDQRPKRRLRVLQTLAKNKAPAVAFKFCARFGEKPALADPRFARHEHDGPLTSSGRAAARGDGGQLGLAADETAANYGSRNHDWGPFR